MNLKDGPCKGMYMCKRAPVFLRAVKNLAGRSDVLNEMLDRPQLAEKIYVYQRDGGVSWMHVKATKGGGFYVVADYHYLADVDGETVRDEKAWDAWVTAHAKRTGGTLADLMAKLDNNQTGRTDGQ